MPIYELTTDAICRVDEVSLISQGIRERGDLQRILRTQIAAIFPDLYVLAEEFGDWEDARRSIDLLCLDKKANLVVVELKRTEDGGHMELQAVRYAAMVSKMTFAEAVNAHAKFLRKTDRGNTDAEAEILKFLEWDEPQLHEFAQDVRIILVSGNFSKEITSAVIWLNERDLDIRCVRLRSHKFDDKTLLDIQQVLPLPEAAEYQVQLRKKAAEERQSVERGSDWTRYDLNIGSQNYRDLYKRRLFLLAIKGLLDHGVSLAELMKSFPDRKFLRQPGKLDADAFKSIVSQAKRPDGSARDLRRYFLESDELLYADGLTIGLSNQWSRHQLPILDELIAAYPGAGISYSKSTEDLSESDEET